MSVASRQNKRKDNAHPPSSSAAPRRGGGPSSGAWRGAHNSPSIMHSPSRATSTVPSGRNTPQQSPQQSGSNISSDPFPPISTKPQPSNTSSPSPLPPSSLFGSTIVVTTLSGSRHQGVLVANESHTPPGVSLKDAKDLVNVGAPMIPSLFIPSQQVANWKQPDNSATPSGGMKNLDSFRTDADIGASTAPRLQRELQAWKPDGVSANGITGEYDRDAQTFGGTHVNGSWDQFAANEHLFGVTTDFNEELYTTKLDKNAADYKERERKAQQLANEILNAGSSNPHVREERQGIDDSGLNEEDKYGAVVRSPNAYVPPGARRPDGSGALVSKQSNSVTTVPKVSVNGPDGAVGGLPGLAAKAASATPQTPPTTNPSEALVNKPGDGGVIASFREFVSTEKQKLVQKKQAIAKNEKDKRIADLIQFSATFKLNKPIPADLVPILAKDQDKQKSIVEKSTKDAADAKARTIGVPTQLSPLPGASSNAVNGATPPPAAAKNMGSGLTPSNLPYKPAAIPPIPAFKGKATTNAASSKAGSGATSSNKPASSSTLPADAQPKREPIIMSIQKIPPFDPSKRRTVVSGGDNKSSAGPAAGGSVNGQPPASPTGSTSSSAQNAFKLNANASSFRPNPTASSFKPGAATSSSQPATSSPSTKPAEAPQPPHPFFGPRPFKNRAPVHIKDDFNPFKITKVMGASTVAQQWPYNGKRIMPPFQPPVHTHVAPQPPPPPYEDDPAVHQAQAQAARAGAPAYGMMFYPYQYPGQPPQQHMMVAPTGPPPAGYMPPQFMPAMPYPPHMPPNVGPGMYAPPPMGAIPPNPAYMPPPPPQGAYPQPNGGPRASISPTPMPQHPYPYHHQSPQMAHAHPVAYPMMMPPPGPAHPHGYEGQPPGPGPMGVGH
ncbi:hypothetical protein FRC03_010101 [Tulasnella sp. 419]|nr:hypothetical protein FRC02_000016 [Tulasnella sp. 418]KAG8967356.1 hypothetical protein FRC03_010101 [Tulasnella sp. 419]